MRENEFSGWLAARLARRPMTVAEFRRRSGVSSSTMSQWLNGKRIPSPQSCDVIADVLGLPIDECLEVAGHRPRLEVIREDDPRSELHALINLIDWEALGQGVAGIAIDQLNAYRRHGRQARAAREAKVGSDGV